ncbi:MAG TPA: L,D-transpeptidase family protein [Gemmatimonadota bacterium]|nr:L,D-transpeptidase family protein [Gemmatimonadota bacterium]
MPGHLHRSTGAMLLALAVACAPEGPREPPSDAESAEVAWDPADTLTDAEIDAGRMDDSWRDAVKLGRPPAPRVFPLDTIVIPAEWLEIGRRRDAGEVLRVQTLLDRARFFPGVLDGRWGKNTEKAVWWFQVSQGLEPTGAVDSLTFERLRVAAGEPDETVVRHILDEDDVAGPFVAIPASVYRQAGLECLCYESLAEKVAERFHASVEVLEELNPGLDLDAVGAGAAILVPAVEGNPPRDGRVERIVVSGIGSYVHAIDADGRIVYHFPTTLGSQYDPSPLGELSVVGVHLDPWFHYQPRLLAGVDDTQPDTHLPPGPNNLVGNVWIKLSEPHYGIHGTRDPATIGYASSSGCVRLTNWNALLLAGVMGPGTRGISRHPPVDSGVSR